jgi:hypothetical protein
MTKTKCGSCQRYFSSTSEFDAHLTGPYGKTPNQHRCLTEAEMVAKGFASEGHRITNEIGQPNRQVWFRPARRLNVNKTAPATA